MDDRELLAALSRVARDRKGREPDDPRWDDLAAGRLGDDEERTLRQEAAATQEGEAALEAFAPLSEGFLDRLEERSFDLLGEPDDEEEESPGAEVVPLRRWHAAPWLAAAGVSLAAAAGLLFVLRPPELSPLPGYEMPLPGGGVQDLRSAGVPSGDGMARYLPTSDIEVVAFPPQPVEGPVAARAFFVRGGQVVAWDAAPEVSQEGAVRFAATVSSLPVAAPGPWDVVVVLGRPETLAAAELKSALAAGEAVPAGLQVVRRPLVLLPSP